MKMIIENKIMRVAIMSLMGMFLFFIAPLYSAASEAVVSSDTLKFEEWEQRTIDIFESKISSGNPIVAKRFLSREDLKDKYLLIDKKKASLLIAKSQAVVDLNKIFDFVWNEDNFNKLSDALGERINDKDNIL